MKDCTKPGVDDNMTVSEKRKYCECMMEKAMSKYPNYSYANTHADDIVKNFLEDCIKEAKH